MSGLFLKISEFEIGLTSETNVKGNNKKKLMEKTSSAKEKYPLSIFINALNRNRWTLIVLILFVFFQSFIENLITDLLVKPILSYFEQRILSDLVFLLSVLLILYFAIKKIKRPQIISNEHVLIVIIVAAYYFYHRVWAEEWIFIGLAVFSPIKYLDFIFILAAGTILIKLWPLIPKKRKEKIDDKFGFFIDEPLVKKEDDKLKRNRLAQNICTKIENTKNQRSSFAIGISSKWGYGKTSFMNLIKENLNKKDSIIIDFNPWLSNNKHHLIKDFFSTLNQVLSKHNTEINPLISEYAEHLTHIANNHPKTNLISNFLFNKNEAFSQRHFNQVKEAILKIPKRIVIFIDDLDRLDKYEIYEVVKIIRNSANFGNTIFIAAFDREYLSKALRQINDHNPESFLEKIFQLEIGLPKCEDILLNDILLNNLSPILPSKERKELEQLINTDDPNRKMNIVPGVLSSIREISRFINSFSIIYDALKEETFFPDLFKFELLRFRYPQAVRVLQFEKQKLISKARNRDNKICYTLTQKENLDLQDEELTDLSGIKKVLIDSGVYHSEIETLLGILNSLFPDPSSLFYYDQNLLSISNPISFERYVHFNLLEEDISFKEFVSYRTGLKEEFFERINHWVKEGFRSNLKEMFEDVTDFQDKEDFEIVIEAIFHLARIPRNFHQVGDDYDGYDFDDLFHKINNYEEYISLGFYLDESSYAGFILSLFNKAPSPALFEVEFIFRLLEKQILSHDFILTRDELEAIRLSYLRNYLEIISEIDRSVWHLYRYADIIELLAGNRLNKRPNPKAITIILNYVKNKQVPEKFLKDLIIYPSRNPNLLGLGDIFHEFFKDSEQFYSFLQEFEETNYISRFKEFYEKTKSKNFSHVQFEF